MAIDGGYDTLIDGQSLRSFAWNVKTYGGIMGIPAKRSTDREIPGQHGVVHIGGETYEAGQIILNMWVLGCQQDGSIPPEGSRGRDQLMQNVRFLSRLFARPGLRQIRQESDLGVVECEAKMVDNIDFTTQAGVTRAEFTVDLIVPHPFWRNLAEVTETLAPSAAAAGVTLGEWAGAIGPQTGLKYEVKGPWSNPRLMNPETGQWVQYEGSLTGSQTWILDGWTSKVGSANVLKDTVRGGVGSTWLDLEAVAPAGPKVLMSGDWSTGASVKVTGRKQYLIP